MTTTIAASIGCGQGGKTSIPNLNWSPYEYNPVYQYKSDNSSQISLSSYGASSVLNYISNVEVDYPYADLYNMEEIKSRLNFDTSVSSHKYSALNESGKLDATTLADIIEKNNEEYLKPKPFGYENVDKEYILEITNLIVNVANHMYTLYPELDWERIYCNLGNLKILNNTGMLSYAQVNEELVLSISKNNTEIVLNMKDENGFRDVIIHETIHILQLGCQCEEIENCKRRAGISIYWDDFLLNTGDWTWLVEGSAERYMCRLTGDKAITYQYKMDYLSTFTLATMLRDSVDSDDLESLSFHNDPNKLFEIFGCKTEKEKDEVIKMMTTMNVLQMQPDRFYDEIKEHRGFDPRESDESLNKLSYELKPAVCISLTKEFYENLTNYVSENSVSANDVFFLINLFEGHMNQHLKFNSDATKEINEPFFREYKGIRNAFFSAIEAENPNLDIDSLYDRYSILLPNSNNKSLNADLYSLDTKEKDYLTERAKWQSDLAGLGQKVPC